MAIRAPFLRTYWPLVLFFSLACLLLWRVVFSGEAFYPAQLLRHLDPWRTAYDSNDLPPWNGLMYDSVGQFYPWRKFAGESIRAGTIPLWNPYQFCGAPFVADSQSAVFYPGNFLYYVLPTATAAGWSVILHLVMAGAFMWIFLKGLGAAQASAALGGIAFAFSTWQVSWLHLPTFLATSCWLPLALHLTGRVVKETSWKRCAQLALVTGLCLLAGHLQIAFYVLLATILFAVFLLLQGTDKPRRIRIATMLACSLVVGALLAASQLLPTLELSRRSHRVSALSSAGYTAYVDYAPDPAALGTLFLPDLFGNPSRPATPYVGVNRGGRLFNYAEGAMYAGLATILLAAFCLLNRGPGRTALFLGPLALLSFLMALGTPLDKLLYFYIPGFGQSGSPGRVLVLWAFAVAALAGLGLDRLISGDTTSGKKLTQTVGAVLLIAIGAIALGARLRNSIDGGEWTQDLVRQVLLFVIAAGVMVSIVKRRAGAIWCAAPVALVAIDLFVTGYSYNPSAPIREVYPSTKLTEFLSSRAGHDRIMPVNRSWNFRPGPRAILPPNGAMAYGLRDVQGYDSLFPGSYKDFMNRLASPAPDASPQEVGNMVFAKNPANPLVKSCGVRLIVSREPLSLSDAIETFVDQAYVYELKDSVGRASARTAVDNGGSVPVTWLDDGPNGITVSSGNDMMSVDVRVADEMYPGWHAKVDGAEVPIENDTFVFRKVRIPPGTHTVLFKFEPASFRTGLYLMLAACSVIAGVFASGWRR